MGRLDGQRALVTGASSGIGAAAAQLLAREGADVALLSFAARRARPDRTAPHGLWQPSGDGELSGHLHGRPSLLAAVQMRGARPPGGGVGRP